MPDAGIFIDASLMTTLGASQSYRKHGRPPMVTTSEAVPMCQPISLCLGWEALAVMLT